MNVGPTRAATITTTAAGPADLTTATNVLDSMGPLGLGGATGTGTGAEQDFVLFDDGATAANTTTSTAMMGNATPLQTPSTFVDPSTSFMGGALQQNPNAFTQYRNAPQQGGGGGGGGGARSVNGNESPFSSPASKPEEEFSSGVVPIAGPSQVPPSGTLSKGTPKSKRARGHAYSSSWNGGNLQQHLHQLQNSGSPPFSAAQMQQQMSGGGGGGGVPMAANASFGGFPAAGSGSDWSGSDTSPRNPPSGTFGPPIHSLSLADGSPDLAGAGMGNDQLASLFPTPSFPVTSGIGGHAANSNAMTAAMHNAGPTSLSAINAFLSAQQQQEDRARQQIRADLMGVDSRALKGQLRDIQRGGVPMTFPNYDGDAQQQQANNLLFPFVPNTTAFGQNAGSSTIGTGQMAANTVGAAAQSQGGLSVAQPGPDGQTPSTSMPGPPARQFSARTQQAVDRARAQIPTRKRFVRENSEQTVSPQQAFLDYDNVDAMLQAAQNSSSSMTSGASLFASMPTTTIATMDMAKAQTQQGNLGDDVGGATGMGVSTPRAMTDAPLFAPPVHESTPSLVDGGSSASSNSRATSSVPSPPQRFPLNRGETVRPSRQQQERDSTSQQSSQSSMFSRSDLGLLSPSESTTSSTEDDEDEKPYVGSSSGGAGFGFGGHQGSLAAASSSSAAGQGSQRGMHGSSGWGPRFSVVSSSSSESEDDFSPQQRGQANAALSSSQQSYGGGGGGVGGGGGARSALAPSQQQAMLGGGGNNAGQSGPANIAALLAGVGGGGGNYANQQFGPPPLDTSAPQMMSIPTQQSSGDAPSESGSQQSQDDSIRKSPVIRSSAQAIYPFGGGAGIPTSRQQAYPVNPTFPSSSQHHGGHLSALQQQQAALAAMASSNPAAFANLGQPFAMHQAGGGMPLLQNVNQPHLTATTTAQTMARANSKSEKEDESEEWDDSEEEGSDSDDDQASYRGGTQRARKPTRGRGRRSRGGGTSTTNSAARRRSHSAGGQAAAAAAGANASTTNAAGLTVCNYVSPLTGEECGTEFHRPYDLARHRETIHAREEATLLRQGKITKEQCVVLYKEVDPARSMATVEWRCDGANGCGALFSRKDALLRHRRIRNH